MTHDLHVAETVDAKPSMRWARWSLPFLALALLALGVMLLTGWSRHHYQNAEDHWKRQLNMMADVQEERVERWLNERLARLADLSQNTSLQLYMTEMQQGGSDGAATLPYLRLMLETLSRDARLEPSATQQGISQRPELLGGLQLYLADGTPVASSRSMPPVPDVIRKAWQDAAAVPGKTVLLGIEASGARHETPLPFVWFAVGVPGVQAEEAVGYAMAASLLDASLYGSLLEGFPGVEGSLAWLLATRPSSDGALRYISPASAGAKPWQQKLSSDETSHVAVMAAQKPGETGIGLTQASQRALFTSRTIEETPWLLVQTIPEAASLGPVQHTIRQVQWLCGLVLALLVVALLLVWRHVVSLRALARGQLYRTLLRKIHRHERLLNLIADHEPMAMALVDERGYYHYCNRQHAARFGMEKQDVAGKHLKAVMGSASAAPWLQAMEKCLGAQALQQWEETRNQGNPEAPGHALVSLVPIVGLLPRRKAPEAPHAVLWIEQDITPVQAAHAHHRKVQQELLDLIVSLIDQRDPFAADHSRRVADLARQMAEAMHQPEAECELTELAGRLMNLGKLFVPEVVLVRKTPLKPSDRAAIRQSLSKAAEFLGQIRFEQPVAEAVRQSQEHVDGSGPLSLRGEAILLSARIIAVANAFVSMTSERAYRSKLAKDAAYKTIASHMGTLYDREVVAVLGTVIGR